MIFRPYAALSRVLPLISAWGCALALMATAAAGDQEYYVGVGLTIDGDSIGSTPWRMKLTPQGQISMHHPTAPLDFAFTPRVAFVFDGSGYRRSELQVGTQLQADRFKMSASPTIVLAEDGRAFAIVPDSLLPTVGGVKLAQVPSIVSDVKTVLNEVGIPMNAMPSPSPPFARISPSPTPLPYDPNCPEVITGAISPSVLRPMGGIVGQLRLTPPMTSSSSNWYRSWREFTGEAARPQPAPLRLRYPELLPP